MSKYTIYKMVYKPDNSRVYIGSTSRKLIIRMNEHRNHEECTMFPIINFLGRKNFCLIPIDYASTKEEAYQKESFWTDFLSNFSHLYNKSSGSKVFLSKDVIDRNTEVLRKYSHEHSGEKHYLYGKHLSKETKEKLSKALSGRKQSKEVIEKRRQGLLERYKFHDHHMKGKHLSEKTKEKLSKANKEKIVSEEQRKKISDALTGLKRRPYTDEEKILMRVRSPKNRAVVCITTGEEFISISDAHRKTGINAGHISSCCSGKRKTAGGMQWGYLEKIS